MKLHKTDKRFKLYQFGFDCFLEFSNLNFESIQNYHRHLRQCREQFGGEFLYFNNRVHADGKYHAVSRHRIGNSYRKRIYFRGEKIYTMLLMTLPVHDERNIYL